jgi:hypothetical protein
MPFAEGGRVKSPLIVALVRATGEDDIEIYFALVAMLHFPYLAFVLYLLPKRK